MLLVKHTYFSSLDQRRRQRRATTTSQINIMIGWVRKNNRAARLARFLVKFFVVVCRTTTWNFHTWCLMIFHSFPLCMKTNCTNKVKGHLLQLFCKNDQRGIIAKHLTLRIGRFYCSCLEVKDNLPNTAAQFLPSTCGEPGAELEEYFLMIFRCFSFFGFCFFNVILSNDRNSGRTCKSTRPF